MITTFQGIPTPESAAVVTILQDALEDGDSVVNRYVLENAIAAFNCDGPYDTGLRLGLLKKNNSAEDMAIDFMSFVNKIFPHSY